MQDFVHQPQGVGFMKMLDLDVFHGLSHSGSRRDAGSGTNAEVLYAALWF